MLCCGLEKNGMVGVWHGHDMASVNQTRPHCVKQRGKTHSKPLAARHGRGTTWARHAICESAFRALLSTLLWSISGDMFVTTSTLLMGTDQFPETWVFEKFTMEFSRADSRIKMWMFSEVSATNSFPIFRVYWWIGSTETKFWYYQTTSTPWR